jgi:hypothetical protein
VHRASGVGKDNIQVVMHNRLTVKVVGKVFQRRFITNCNGLEVVGRKGVRFNCH